MNNEDISLNKTIETQEDLHIHDEYNNNKTSTRVNINSLMSKVRAQEKKQKKENIVFVGVTSSHRKAAFRACEFIMDFLKTKAPFWKKEFFGDKSRWVEFREQDEVEANRWENVKS